MISNKVYHPSQSPSSEVAHLPRDLWLRAPPARRCGTLARGRDGGHGATSSPSQPEAVKQASVNILNLNYFYSYMVRFTVILDRSSELFFVLNFSHECTFLTNPNTMYLIESRHEATGLITDGPHKARRVARPVQPNLWQRSSG